MASLAEIIREFNTLSTIKEIFGDTEFTKKQYDYVRHVTGNQLLSLDTIRSYWRSGECLNTRKEALFGNGLDEEEVCIMAERQDDWNGGIEVTRSIPVKEIENLPEKVHEYIRENMVEENRYRIAKHSSSYRNFFKVHKGKMNCRIDELKNSIKNRTSDAEIATLENQLRALQNRIATILKIREEIED